MFSHLFRQVSSISMEAKQQNIVVQVSALTGDPIHVTVSQIDTVARLKRHIFKAIALPVAQQRLMFRSTQLTGAQDLVHFVCLMSRASMLAFAVAGQKQGCPRC